LKFKPLLLSVCLALSCAQTVQAKGFALINTGDELFEVADFPSKLVGQFPALRAIKAGYKCNHLGVFWADVWTWNCKLVGVTSNSSYIDLPPAIAGELSADSQYSIRHARRGFWNHYGFWAALAGLLGFGLIRKFAR
jgi:hypothetical protein